MKFELQGNGEWESINIVVIGRTGIVHSEKRKLKQIEIDDSKMQFNFTATDGMVPTAHVIVYYIAYLGEIVYDQKMIDVTAPVSNKVSIVSSFYFSSDETFLMALFVVGIENFKRNSETR